MRPPSPARLLDLVSMRLGVMLCNLLYSICLLRRLSVSYMVSCMERVMLSAYIITSPLTFLAALPAVCVSDRPERRKPSLSASSMATSETDGMSSPSLSRFTPTSTSKSPFLKSSMIFTLSIVSTSECMYSLRTPIFTR